MSKPHVPYGTKRYRDREKQGTEMLLLMAKYFILDRPSLKLPSALPKNCVSIFIHFCFNISFA